MPEHVFFVYNIIENGILIKCSAISWGSILKLQPLQISETLNSILKMKRGFHWHPSIRLNTKRNVKIGLSTFSIADYGIQCIIELMGFWTNDSVFFCTI